MAFVEGVASSLVASIIIYLFRFRIGFILNFLFSYVYPNVSGIYTIYEYAIIKERSNDSSNNDQELSGDIKKNIIKKNNNLKADAPKKIILEELKKNPQAYYIKLKIRQFTNRLEGKLSIIKGGDVIESEKVNGKITPSRIMVLTAESIDKSCHNFGTYLFKLENDQRIIAGTRSRLCIECGDAFTRYIIMEKDN